MWFLIITNIKVIKSCENLVSRKRLLISFFFLFYVIVVFNNRSQLIIKIYCIIINNKNISIKINNKFNLHWSFLIKIRIIDIKRHNLININFQWSLQLSICVIHCTTFHQSYNSFFLKINSGSSLEIHPSILHIVSSNLQCHP